MAHTHPDLIRRNVLLLLGSMIGTVLVLRVALHASPDSDFTVGSYNIHHLFTGLLLITIGGVPLAIFRSDTPRMRFSVLCFGAGLGMALDEWVYLIATDGSNASYLLPISLWGGVLVVGLALGYATVLALYRMRTGRAQARRE